MFQLPPMIPIRDGGKHPVIGTLLALIAVAIFVAVGWFVFQVTTQPPPTGETSEDAAQESHALIAKEFSTAPRAKSYKVKKDMSVLGMGVVRIEHRQYPQEFVVLDGVGTEVADEVFDGKVGASFVEPMINQVLAFRMPEKKVSMHVEELETLEADNLRVKDQTLPHRRMRIKFKLSTEEQPRVYEGAMVRKKEADGKRESIVVSFTRVKDDNNALAYDPKLMNDFLEAL